MVKVPTTEDANAAISEASKCSRRIDTKPIAINTPAIAPNAPNAIFAAKYSWGWEFSGKTRSGVTTTETRGANAHHMTPSAAPDSTPAMTPVTKTVIALRLRPDTAPASVFAKSDTTNPIVL